MYYADIHILLSWPQPFCWLFCNILHYILSNANKIYNNIKHQDHGFIHFKLHSWPACMFLNAWQKGLVNQGSNSIPPISIRFLLKTIGAHKKSMQFIVAINVSIKTCITSLVAKKSNQLRAQGRKFHPYGPSKDDSACK